MATLQTDRGVREKELLQLLNMATLSSEERKKLECLVTEFAHVFALNNSELGHTSTVTHKIDTSNHPPIKQAATFSPQEQVCDQANTKYSFHS